MPIYALKAKLAERLSDTLGKDVASAEQLLSLFGNPPKLELGHVALPCFSLAKPLGKKSNELANELAEKFPDLQARATGPYVNFKWNLKELFQETVGEILKQGKLYGSDQSGQGEKVIVEFCSPNVAKRLAFHHIRSTLIGSALSNVYKTLGYDVQRMNFVGDWGSQFARLVAAMERWGDREKLGGELDAAMDHLFEVYVRFHKELDEDPKLLEDASQCLSRLEAGDENVMGLWRQVREVSLSAMERTLKRLQVQFDLVEGESRYVSGMEKVLEEIKAKAGAEKSEGAWIVRIDGISTPALIQKTDGTTLYLTRDIAAAIDRFERFQFGRMFYVVSGQQSLHFKQLFATLGRMGIDWSERLEHLSFGIVRFGSEKMSTREGNVVLLDTILDEAKSRALALCSEKNPDLKEKEEVAEKVGMAAVIFAELSAHMQRDIDFNWDHVLSFDGETGPYVLYSLVRCYSLLDKAAEKGVAVPTDVVEPAGELHAEEEPLILALSNFRSVLHTVVSENEPFYLPRYLIDLAKVFNRFYYQLPVLQSTDESLRNHRLQLVLATQKTLENGLRLLGIRCPREM